MNKNTQRDRRDRNPPLYVTLFWLALAALACIGALYLAKGLGAGWRLYTLVAIGAGLAVLVLGGLCCTANAYDRAHGMK